MPKNLPPPAPPAERETPRHAIPAYPVRHSGTVLVLGHGFTLHDDVARARKIRPDADVIAVNKAAVEYKADHLFSWHHERGKLKSWAGQQFRKFGPGAVVHSTPGRDRATGVLLDPPEGCPEVDFWWPGAVAKGSSGWMAVRLATFLGYEERILCGVPMAKGAYADGFMARDFMRDSKIESYRSGIAADTAYHKGTYSMSGWTRDLLGEPPC